MCKNILILLGVGLLVACGGDKKEPSQIKDQENVYHVFDQDLEKEKKSAQKKQKKNTKALKSEPKIVPTTTKANSPLSIIQQYTSELQALDQKTKNSDNRDSVISKKVRKFFDFDTLARESLGTHWHQINRDDQKEYSDLFISLVERSYLTRSKTLVGNYELSFQNETIKKNKSTVDCVVKKDDVDIDIIYHLHKNHGKWMIYNIVFDHVDLIKNYQNQFGRIIEKKEFSGLVSTMRKKLNSGDQAVSL